MAIDLIVGPPNSGRVRRDPAPSRSGRSTASPLLIVPTGDDIARFERDLCAAGAPAIGATIRTFGAVFSDDRDRRGRWRAAGALPAPTPGPDTDGDRRKPPAGAGALIGVARLRAALDNLVAELQAALVSPVRFRGAAEATGEAELELELATCTRSTKGCATGGALRRGLVA